MSSMSEATLGGGGDSLDIQELQEYYREAIGLEKQFSIIRSELAKKHHIQEQQDALKSLKKGTKAYEKAEKALNESIKRARQESENAIHIYRLNLFKKTSGKQLKELREQIKKEIDLKKQQVAEELEITIARLEAEQASEHQIAEAREKARQQQLELDRQIFADFRAQIEGQKEAVKERKKEFKEADGFGEKSKVALKKVFSGAFSGLESLGKGIKSIHETQQENLEAANAQVDILLDAYESAKANGESAEALKEARKDIRKATAEAAKEAGKTAATAAMSAMKDSYDAAFKEAENMLTTYKSHIDARLQGSDKSYNDIMDKISSNLAMSPYVKTQEVIGSMREAVDQGISYNIEQRAFLQTISDKIANTFNAFDSNLTRLIKLQQADTTAARLGMEAALTKFLNSTFQDSSYLQGLSDSVAGAILDASSTLSREMSAEFEFTVQKWLGSLSSVGASDSLIQNIATGLNYLATGDVTSLSSNTQLQTLFAMSSARAGLDYSDILLNGLNSSTTNKLLSSMVTYLREIAENSDSQVVRSAYGEIFNMSLSDMKAITNLKAEDINNIFSTALSYGGMTQELQNQFNAVSQRSSMAEMLSNVYNNAMFGVAEDMVSSPATYAMTKMLDFMDKSKIDIKLPFLNIFGSGLDLNTSVQGLMRLALGVSQAFSLAGNILSGLGSGGGLNLDSWGAEEYTSRGSGMTFTTGSTQAGKSGSSYVSNSSSQDMQNSAVSSATDDADDTTKITNKNTKTEHNFDEFYDAVVGENAKSFIKTYDYTVHEHLKTVFGYTSLLDSETGGIKVHETSTIKVRVVNDTLPVDIKNMSYSNTQGSVGLNSQSSTVNAIIDEDALVSAFSKAMGHSSSSNIKTLNDLMTALQDGTLVVKIANPTGTKLAVDTEFLETIGSYNSSIRI